MASAPKPTRSPRNPLRRPDGSDAVTAVVVAVVLIVGIQLGGLPWRYRQQLWQLQGGLIGALVGYVVGRLSAAADRQDPPGC